jgi:Leucine-rich repeat (LRR) protein
VVFTLINFNVEGINVECEYISKYCRVSKADFSIKTIGENFNFAGSRNEKRKTGAIQFWHSPKLAHIPQNIFQEYPNLVEFGFYSSIIPILKKNLFRPEFHQTQELYLPDNGIKIIEKNAFAHLPNLVLIDLSGNQIQSLNGELFAINLNLNRIDLRKNRVRMIEPQFMNKFNQFRAVELEGNECINRNFGCSLCSKIGSTELNRDPELMHCFENYQNNLNMLNEGENLFL